MISGSRRGNGLYRNTKYEILAAIGQDVYHTSETIKAEAVVRRALISPSFSTFPIFHISPLPISHFPGGRSSTGADKWTMSDRRQARERFELDKFIFAFISIRRTFVKSCLRVCGACTPTKTEKTQKRSNLTDIFKFFFVFLDNTLS